MGATNDVKMQKELKDILLFLVDLSCYSDEAADRTILLRYLIS